MSVKGFPASAGPETVAAEGGVGSVDLEEAPELAREIGERRLGGLAHWPVPVTDLIDPRPAFFRRFAPVPLPPERRRRRGIGTLRHGQWVRFVGRPEQAEVRVQRAGVVGVVDLLEPDGPTELKTTGRIPSIERWLEERGSHVDQLGLYVALTGTEQGHLVVAAAEGEAGRPPVVALRCRFRDTAGLLDEASARADRFRRALRSIDPGELPRCLWVGRGCPFQEARACDCSGEEPPDDRWVRDRLVESAPDAPTEARWRSAIQAAEGTPAPVVLAFRDLLYPRRSYYERVAPERIGEERPIDPQSQEAYRELSGAVDAGPDGERSQRLAASGEPPGSIPLFRGLPFLLKTRSGVPWPSPVPRLAVPSHYIDELGFRAAAVGGDAGYVFVDELRSRAPQRRERVLRLRFRDIGAYASEFERRRSALREALERGDPGGLSPCPAWRADGCPYAPGCGCATPIAPS